jgi:glycosyltransferase involved in cell wall biosynthesis
LHDVIDNAEFTSKRLAKIDMVFVKTNSHREIFINIPDEKITVIPNGIDPSLFEEKIEKNPYLILNTSSPDRHLDATLDIFEKLIKKSDKPWKLAWYYGWGVYDQVHVNNKEMMDWKKVQTERFNKLVKEGRAEGGFMINHKDIAKKYLEAGIFLYPTEFREIHCISAVKAQLAGCRCITSDAFALNETIKYGQKIHTNCEKWTKDNTFGDTQTQLYVEAILGADDGREGEIGWAKDNFNWHKIGNLWNEKLSS